jgi:hypothetical protein
MLSLTKKLLNLQPGKHINISMNSEVLDEKLSVQGEGYLVEHYTMYHLASNIKNGKQFALRGNPEDFKKSKGFINNYNKADDTQRSNSDAKGKATADRIYKDLVQENPDLLSLEAYITPQDIVSNGSADLVIRFYRDTQSELMKTLRISLKKAERKGGTQMGMKVLVAFLEDVSSKIANALNIELENTKDEIGSIKKLITDPEILRKLQFMVDAKRISTFFSDRSIPNKDRMNHKIFSDFINSPFYKNDTNLSDRGYDKEKVFFTSRDQRATRASAWQSYLVSKGYSKPTIQSYGADVFNHIVQNYLDNPKVVQVIREKIKWMIGFDDVEIYKVLPQGGVLDVKRFNETDGYKKIMDAINNSSDIRFRHAGPKSNQIHVEVYALGQVVARFSFGINYLAGEFQINIDYDNLKAGKIT